MQKAIRQLAGETAIYGMSTILARIVNFMLVPLYTRVLTQSDYGSLTEFNAYIPKMVSNSWLSVSDSGYSNDQRLFKITAAPNDSQETRKSIVLFNRGNTTYRVTVSQEKQAF